MQIVVNNYNQDDLSWLPKGEVFVYDKKELNVGYNIYDYMDWIVNNYNKLDDIVLFTKGNMLKRHITPEEWDKIKDNKCLTPILTFKHDTNPGVSWYENGLYCEVNNYWYLNHYGVKDEFSVKRLVELLGIKDRSYLSFAPGACWIVPRENILKHDIMFYKMLRDAVSYKQLPGEAHLIERSLYYIWS